MKKVILFHILNERKPLIWTSKSILLKGEDKTDKINRCVYEDGKYKVTFLQGKTYTYNYGNVQRFRNPVPLDSATNVVYKDKLPVSGGGFGVRLEIFTYYSYD